MPTVLITLYGAERSVDLEMPGDAPVSQLGQLLREAAEPMWVSLGSSSATPHGVGTVNGTMLPPDRTLVECGVFDGAVLVLRNDGLWIQQLPTAGDMAPIDNGPDPQVGDTGGIGIRWNKEGLLP